MAAFNFPGSPSVGTIYNAPNGPSYSFDGSVWQGINLGNPATVYTEATPPPAPAEDQLWFNTDTGQLSVYIAPTWRSAGMPEPPSDGQTYVRLNAAWSAGLIASNTGITIKTDSDGTPQLFEFGENGTFTTPGEITVDPPSGFGKLSVNAPAGANYASTYYRRGGLPRWRTSMNSAAEDGADAGSNFEIVRYTDAGATLSPTPFSINRATGIVSINTTLNVGGAVHTSFNGPPISTLVGGSTIGALIEGALSGHIVVGLRNNDTGDTFSVVSYGTAGVAPYDTLAFKVDATGATTTGGNITSRGQIITAAPASGAAYFTANSQNSAAIINLDKAVGTIAASAYIDGKAAGKLRWRLNLASSALESTGNAGSDFYLACYADDGATFIGYPMVIDRSSMLTTLGGAVTVTGVLTAPSIVAGNIYNSINSSYLRVSGGNAANVGGNIEIYGGTGTYANRIYYDADVHVWRTQNGASTGQMVFTPGSLEVDDVFTDTITTAAVACSGNVNAGQNFIGGGAAVVLAPGSVGTIYLRPQGSGSGTNDVTISSAGTVTVKGAINCAGSIYSTAGHLHADLYVYADGSCFIGGTTQAVLGTPSGIGAPVYLRPNGYNSSTGQMSLNTAGDIYTAGMVTCDSYAGSSDAVMIVFATGAGAVYLRPNGSGATAGQAYVTTAGDFVVSAGSMTAVGTVVSNQSFASSTASVILGTTGSGTVYFRPNGYTSTSNQGYVSSDGSLTISGNITASGSTVYGTALHSTGYIYGAGGYSSTGAADGWTTNVWLRGSTTTGASTAIAGWYNPNGNVGNIVTINGGCGYTTSSDETLKNVDGEYDRDDAIRIIREDPVMDWTWKADGTREKGWVAQKSHAVHPQLAFAPSYHEDDLKMRKNRDVEPKAGEPGFKPWGIDYGRRTPYLWAALSKALDLIDQLTADVAMLKGQKT